MNRACPVCGLRNTFLVSFPGSIGLVYWIRCDDCGTEFRVASHRTKRGRPHASAIVAWGIFVFILLLGIAILAMHFLGIKTIEYHRSALVISDH
jgi:hypothetical protein